METDVRVKGGLVALVGGSIGGRFRVPPEATIRAWGDDLPYDLKVRTTLRHGRLVCTELVCTAREGGEPVTPEGIRRVPLARVIRKGLEKYVTKVEPLGTSYKGHPVHKGGPVGPWDDELVQVAAVYRLAHACGDHPTKAVSELLDLPTSTAAKKVMAARKQGLLEPTSRGKAGG